MILLPQEIVLPSLDFKRDVQQFGHNIDFQELSTSKGQRNYRRVIKRLEEINLPDPNLLKYNRMSLDEFTATLEELLIKILGESKREEIKHLNGLLKPTHELTLFDSVVEEDQKGADFIPKAIHINKKLSTIQLGSVANSYVRAMLAPYKGHELNRVLSNYHYYNLLSVLTEYIAIYELSEMLKEPSLRDTQSLVRAHNDKENAIEHRNCEKLKTQVSKMKLDRGTVVDMKMCFDFEEHSSFGHIVSDIYSRRLLDMYKEDPKALLTIMRHIIHGEQSINELLKFYNVSLTNEPTIERFESDLEMVKKI